MKLHAAVFSALGLGGLATAAIPSSPYCTGQCADYFAEGYNFDYKSWVSKNVTADPFYQVPADTKACAPGDIIKWEDLANDTFTTKYTIPGGMSLSRFTYMSEDVNGALIPASAFLLMPYSLPTGQDKLRTIVWAHGTSGWARQCGPSNHRNLYYEWSAPYSFAAAGYAVIGPDYAGLGTDIPQGFMYEAGYAHAADVALSLVAARKRVGQFLTDEWVTIGQSEGGMTAWRTNERLSMPNQQALLSAGKFLGSVAIAPALRPLDILMSPGFDANGGYAVGVYVFETLSKLYPKELSHDVWLTEKGRALLKLYDASCVYGGAYLAGAEPYSAIFTNASWMTTNAAKDWRKKYNGQGYNKLSAPLLVIQGTEDAFVPEKFTQQDFKTVCSQRGQQPAQLHIYPGQDHDTPTIAGQSDYLGWVRDRFDGVALDSGCSVHTHGPLRSQWNPIPNVYVADETLS